MTKTAKRRQYTISHKRYNCACCREHDSDRAGGNIFTGIADSITAGQVEAVNISYGFINVSYSEDGVAKNETVYCKDGTTTVINASGKTVKLSGY